MKVKELIAALSQMNQDADLVLSAYANDESYCLWGITGCKSRQVAFANHGGDDWDYFEKNEVRETWEARDIDVVELIYT